MDRCNVICNFAFSLAESHAHISMIRNSEQTNVYGLEWWKEMWDAESVWEWRRAKERLIKSYEFWLRHKIPVCIAPLPLFPKLPPHAIPLVLSFFQTTISSHPNPDSWHSTCSYLLPRFSLTRLLHLYITLQVSKFTETFSHLHLSAHSINDFTIQKLGGN